MNEVNMSSAVIKAMPRTASSQGAVDSRPELPNKAAVDAAKSLAKEVKADSPSSHTAADVKQAVAELNDFVQTLQRNLQFTVDEDLDKTVIKVVDGVSGEVIRQIPEEFILEMARKIGDQGEFHLVNALG